MIDIIDKDVLQKLFIRRIIGAHHLRIDTLLRSGWKPNERGQVKRSVAKLIRLKLIVWVKKSKNAIALNKERIGEIKEIIRKC